jgi:hypothetical protein
LKKDIVEAPFPHEEKLLNIQVKDIAFPNGRTVKLRMSRWHWDMVEYIDQGDDYETGILFKWVTMRLNKTDNHTVEGWRAGVARGSRPTPL